MLKKILICILAFSSVSFAETQNPAEQSVPAPSTKDKVVEALNTGKDQVVQALSHSRLVRSNSEYFVAATYSPLDLILPSKWGVTAGVVKDPDYTWEFEYLKSSVSVPFLVDDIGEMTDERFSLIRRNYMGTETFNFNYGLSYFRYKVHIGNKYLASVSTSVPETDLIRVDSLGFNLGIGNRWILASHWIVGVDWVSWSQPIVSTRVNNKFDDYSNDSGYKDTIDTAVKLIKWVPRLTLLKLQVGYSF